MPEPNPTKFSGWHVCSVLANLIAAYDAENHLAFGSRMRQAEVYMESEDIDTLHEQQDIVENEMKENPPSRRGYRS